MSEGGLVGEPCASWLARLAVEVEGGIRALRQQVVGGPHHLLIPAGPDNRPCRIERSQVLGHPVVDLEWIGGLAQVSRNVDALTEARPELHRLAHCLRTGGHGR